MPECRRCGEPEHYARGTGRNRKSFIKFSNHYRGAKGKCPIKRSRIKLSRLSWTSWAWMKMK
ncbi:MAG: hypothetical protein LC731_06910 [Acidobacteria bacterium]|nr:hypothetical protein [Acidobacteriota bacterium]